MNGIWLAFCKNLSERSMNFHYSMLDRFNAELFFS